MPLHWALISEVGHYATLAPLVICLIRSLAKREPTPEAWLLSGAFFVSFITDQIGIQLALEGRNNWWTIYIEAPIQFGLFAAVVAQRRAIRSMAVMGILMLGLVGALRGTLGRPETLTQVIGGLLVSWLVIDVPRLKRYRPALLVYCLAAAPFLLAMGSIDPYAPVWPWIWTGYVGTRVVALSLMSWALVREVTQEAPHGSWLVDHPRERRVGVRGVGGGDRHVLAQTKR